MDSTYHSEFHGAYLEDSFPIEIAASSSGLALKMVFALTTDHPDYHAPKPGEAHCYRDGNILIRHPIQITTRSGRPTFQLDLDGAADLGEIQLHQYQDTSFLLLTDWFEARFSAEQIHVDFT